MRGYKHELRDLARGIELLLQNSQVSNQAKPIVDNCVNHLILLARRHERDHDDVNLCRARRGGKGAC